MRPHLLVYCDGREGNRHKPTPLGRLIDCRSAPASTDDVVPLDEWAEWKELVQQLTPGQALPGAPVRAGTLINWQPVAYVGTLGVELSRLELSSRSTRNGDLWTIPCSRLPCKRQAVVSDTTLCKVFDEFVGKWRDDQGQPIVALVVLEQAVRVGW